MSKLKKKYDIIMLDPPWKYNSSAYHKGKFRGGACGHYPLLSFEELSKLDLLSIAKENCMMIMWGTRPMLEEQIALMRAWGFPYKTTLFTWVKLNKKSDSLFFGPGYYTRGNTEVCLLGVRGKPLQVKNKSIQEPLLARIGQHSQKPKEVREMIEELWPNTDKIELFASGIAKGWDSYGMAIDGMDIRDYLYKDSKTEKASSPIFKPRWLTRLLTERMNK